MKIRPARDEDRDDIWKILHPILATGETYAIDPQISRDQMLGDWFGENTYVYVAEDDQQLVGTYQLKANRGGGGSHVANAAFFVAPIAQHRGIGRAMGEHCLNEARRLGFRAMQFNFVSSTNHSAIHLWQQLGFKIVGTLPGAFVDPEKGYVDVYVMFRSLVEDSSAKVP